MRGEMAHASPLISPRTRSVTTTSTAPTKGTPTSHIAYDAGSGAARQRFPRGRDEFHGETAAEIYGEVVFGSVWQPAVA
jgi:hypothetical protein